VEASIRRRIIGQLTDAYEEADPDRVRRELDAILEAAAGSWDGDEIRELAEIWSIRFPRRMSGWRSVEDALADLRRRLGAQQKRSRVWSAMRRSATWAAEHYVVVAGLVTAAATLFYGLAYARFYGQFNITPEQAGTSPAQILTHSVGGGLLLIGLIAAGTFCTLIAPIALREDRGATADRGSWRMLGANALVTALGIAAMFTLALTMGVPWQMAAYLSFWAVLILVAVSFRFKREGRRRGLEPRPLRFDLDRYLTMALAVALPTGVLMAGFTTFRQAEQLSVTAREGRAVRDPTIAGIPFLGVRAEPALISWTNDQAIPDLPHCAIYLGGVGENAILYDHRTDSTFHVPTGAFTLELRGRVDNCDAPVNVGEPRVGRKPNGDLVCHRGKWESWSGAYYIYDWTAVGATIQRPGRSRQARTLSARSSLGYRRVHCRVRAESPFGTEVAVSRGVGPRSDLVSR
jgi:hypothetical protein